MYPTYCDGQTAYTIKALFPIQRGNIVVAVLPKFHKFLIKRVVGLPGDTVEIRPDGSILVNGIFFEPSHGNALLPPTDAMSDSTDRGEKIVLGEEEYFLLGDNSANSNDSRQFGPVSRLQILEIVIKVV